MDWQLVASHFTVKTMDIFCRVHTRADVGHSKPFNARGSSMDPEFYIGVERGGQGAIPHPIIILEGGQHTLCAPPPPPPISTHIFLQCLYETVKTRPQPNNPPKIFLQCLCETVKTRSQMYQFNKCTFYFI